MGGEPRRFVVRDEAFTPGSTYRNTAKSKHPDDQFMRWINLPESGMANAPGIRPLWYLSRKPFTELPAFLVLVTKATAQGGTYKPWKEDIKPLQGTITYWGDAKLHSTKRVYDFQGNKVLQQIWDAYKAGARDELPPILHFVKHEVGSVTFTGLCALTALKRAFFTEKDQRVENLRCKLRILGSEPVPLAWLHSRREAKTSDQALRSAPASWLAWIGEGRLPFSPPLNAKPLALPWAADDRSPGQGFSSDPRIRKAVEDYAMKRARDYFQQERGFTDLKDVSRTRPYDFLGWDGEREVYIEVKGTQTAGSTILLTPNEVEFARRNKSQMALFVVHSMKVRDVDGEVHVEGGEERVSWPWDVENGQLTPVKFAYSFPEGGVKGRVPSKKR
ncbi:MAG TPA: DUF3883 domain-containing protein [Myxococcaceae bacterium]|nr:DUF3883 domain-containing protein [Myxococcaceae bacterium]